MLASTASLSSFSAADLENRRRSDGEAGAFRAQQREDYGEADQRRRLHHFSACP